VIYDSFKGLILFTFSKLYFLLPAAYGCVSDALKDTFQVGSFKMMQKGSFTVLGIPVISKE
jgi:hypothetical protein